MLGRLTPVSASLSVSRANEDAPLVAWRERQGRIEVCTLACEHQLAYTGFNYWLKASSRRQAALPRLLITCSNEIFERFGIAYNLVVQLFENVLSSWPIAYSGLRQTFF
jgi:hypothetical protein